MIIGIGTDIIEIKRVEQAAKESFLNKYFTENEILIFKNKGAKSLAANFAAKEAFAKALGTGVRGFSLKEVEVLRNNLGAPYINLYGNAKNLAEERNVKAVNVSLSHSKDCALAFIVLE